MTKKIIALMAVITIVFVCTFAACDKGTYTNPATGTKYDLVTDENGQKVLAEDGELLVYATDENGKYVTNESGELETQKQAFIGQIEENGVVEDYAYYIALPEGWVSTDTYGAFKNGDTKQISISIEEAVYSYVYNELETLYKAADKNESMVATIEDDVEFIDGAENVSRITITQDNTVAVIYLFENSGNVYKIVYGTIDAETAIEDCVEFCRHIVFKPYTYYPDVTAKSSEE